MRLFSTLVVLGFSVAMMPSMSALAQEPEGATDTIDTAVAPSDSIKVQDMVTPPSETKAPEPLVQTPPAEERQWHVGGSAGVALLPMMKFAVQGNYTRWLSAEAGFGSFRIDRKVGGSTMSYATSSKWVELRGHPFGGSFFLGCALGAVSTSLKGDYTFETEVATQKLTVPTEISLTFGKTYLAPKLGWFSHWPNGFAIGTDFGWQVPMGGVNSEFDVSAKNAADRDKLALIKQTKEYKDQKDSVESAGDVLGKKLGLEWNVLKMGWLF